MQNCKHHKTQYNVRVHVPCFTSCERWYKLRMNIDIHWAWIKCTVPFLEQHILNREYILHSFPLPMWCWYSIKQLHIHWITFPQLQVTDCVLQIHWYIPMSAKKHIPSSFFHQVRSSIPNLHHTFSMSHHIHIDLGITIPCRFSCAVLVLSVVVITNFPPRNFVD